MAVYHGDAPLGERHAIHNWVYADAAARGAATGFVAADLDKVALQLSDGSYWRLTATTPTWAAVGSGGMANPMTTAEDVIVGGASGTPTRLAKGAANTVLGVNASGVLGYKADPSGGGAPVAAAYLTTAPHADLTAETAIPGLAGSPDRLGVGGGAVSEEYDTAATGLTWTPSDPATADSNATIPSHLYLRATDSTERFGLRAWTPGAGAFDARAKLGVATETISGSQVGGAGLLIADATNATRLVVQLLADPALVRWIVQAYTYDAGAYTQRGANWIVYDPDVYVRATRDGADNVTFWWSNDGLIWQAIATLAFAVTVAQIGYRLSGGGITYAMHGDWLRAIP